MSEGFFCNLNVALLFFRICRRYHITDYHARVALIRELTARGKAKYIRDAKSFLSGKKVLKIEGNNDNN